MSVKFITGDCREKLAELPDQSVHCCVTSPPYFGLRDYGVEGQIGLESSLDEFLEIMVDIFHQVRRVLRDDGTLWVNVGDSYASRPNGSIGKSTLEGSHAPHAETRRANGLRKHFIPGALKHKDLMGMPWRVAFALQADGWYLRQDIVWSKPNPMPESVADRCTKSHEYLFLLSKMPRYYYDIKAIKEPVSGDPDAPRNRWDTKDYVIPGQKPQKRSSRTSGNKRRKTGVERGCPAGNSSNVCGSVPWEGSKRNKRSVWTVATRPLKEAHFATFPPALIEPCILAGCPEGGTVLDPFGGAGTTGLVADRLQRNAILIELNEQYMQIAKRRIYDDAPLFGVPA